MQVFWCISMLNHVGISVCALVPLYTSAVGLSVSWHVVMSECLHEGLSECQYDDMSPSKIGVSACMCLDIYVGICIGTLDCECFGMLVY